MVPHNYGFEKFFTSTVVIVNNIKLSAICPGEKDV